MKAKKVLIFGGSGQIGRNLIRKLTKNNYIVTVVTRNIHQKSYIIKTQANAGYIDIVEANIFDENKIRNLFKKADICINLIGILFEKKGGNTFKNIHSIFPSLLSKLCKQYNLKHFIHLSALGINDAIDSDYAKSKLEGEANVLKNFPLATILRPSIVYSVDDNFTTNFMTLLNRLPIFPLYHEGKTKFAPIHCSDLTDTINYVISKNIYSKIIECVGPEIISFKESIRPLQTLSSLPHLLLNVEHILFLRFPPFQQSRVQTHRFLWDNPPFPHLLHPRSQSYPSPPYVLLWTPQLYLQTLKCPLVLTPFS